MSPGSADSATGATAGRQCRGARLAEALGVGTGSPCAGAWTGGTVRRDHGMAHMAGKCTTKEDFGLAMASCSGVQMMADDAR